MAHRMSLIFYPSNKVTGREEVVGGGEYTDWIITISACLSIHPSVCQCVQLQGHLKLIECLSVLCFLYH